MDTEHCDCCELGKAVYEILKILKELHMSEVTLTINFNVTNPTNPLTVTPASETENLVVGQPVSSAPIAVVSGGVPPYAYAVDPTSGALPPGVTVVEDLNGNISLSGTPTTAGQSTAPYILDITDSAGAQAQLKTAIKAA